ncbi:hypothetical protein [Anaerotruncus sp. DFI.9.16]|uniref:hypothetical protein n=1 Tax=Anaerotruncus sp. DFI.9.16 TaxID=2965275 RepID=UPI002109F694|nr:hypothetical protein [Anaerotruncus sp. DFI.9.16]
MAIIRNGHVQADARLRAPRPMREKIAAERLFFIDFIDEHRLIKSLQVFMSFTEKWLNIKAFRTSSYISL